MARDVETDPEFQAKLDQIEEFARTRVEPLDLVFGSFCDVADLAEAA